MLAFGLGGIEPYAQEVDEEVVADGLERAGLRKVVEQPVSEPHRLPDAEIGIAMAQDMDLPFDPVEGRPCASLLSAQRVLSCATPTPSTAAAITREPRPRKGRA